MKVTIWDASYYASEPVPAPVGVRPERDEVTGELIAWDRAETDSCERGTPGCAIHHSGDSDCQTW
jgi:hypothetical protein